MALTESDIELLRHITYIPGKWSKELGDRVIDALLAVNTENRDGGTEDQDEDVSDA